jgi:type IV pilus assembly protein PilW
MKPALPSAEQGYSLVELLVVIVILGLVTTAIMTTFITGQRHHSERDAAIRMQQQARLAMTEMERNIRMAGYGLMDIGSMKINFYPGANPINPSTAWVMVEATDGAGGNPDSITFRYQNPELPTDESTNPVRLTADYPSPNPTSLPLTDSTGFIPKDLLIIYDPAEPNKPASLLQVSSVPNATQIHHARQSNNYPYNPPISYELFPSGGYNEGSVVLNLRTIDFRTVTYSISGENLIREDRKIVSGSSIPIASTRIVATGIEDLQIRYQFSDGTWRNDIVDASPPTELDKTHDIKDVRGVRISIIARSAKPDPRYPGQAAKLTGELGNGKTYDSSGYRRMQMSSMVTLRNLSMPRYTP